MQALIKLVDELEESKASIIALDSEAIIKTTAIMVLAEVINCVNKIIIDNRKL